MVHQVIVNLNLVICRARVETSLEYEPTVQICRLLNRHIVIKGLASGLEGENNVARCLTLALGGRTTRNVRIFWCTDAFSRYFHLVH